ncbi:class I SAM-dependent methyltransferase [Pseudomonas akapageensis]|uniref:class I SAM-dependent methyltransferase n=1 Tax=Pseudomonas akapageensis TaxID=2609961 RepID=UPI00140E34B4|nr:class I SAM-dependent methyltransferase [Pseudomonas akapageensis]
MRRCINCKGQFDSQLEDCPACGASVAQVDGFKSFAPALAHGGGGFKSNYFSELAELEGENFWFKARNRLVIWALHKYRPHFRSFLEIGCGTGYVLSGVSKEFPQANLRGSEIFTAGLGFAANRLPTVKFMQMDARDIPFFQEFDVVGAFDVLEHIKEDEQVLKQIHAALMPAGILLMSVPQHMWLWSPADDYACHERRYSAAELHGKIESAGFEIVRSTSFVSVLLPLMMASRATYRKSKEEVDVTSELKLPRLLNKILYAMMLCEGFLIKMGINLPVGGSRLVVAVKK